MTGSLHRRSGQICESRVFAGILDNRVRLVRDSRDNHDQTEATVLSPTTRECILATQSPPPRVEDIDGRDATVVVAHLGGELVDECTVRLLNSDGSVTDSRTVSLDLHSHSVLSMKANGLPVTIDRGNITRLTGVGDSS